MTSGGLSFTCALAGNTHTPFLRMVIWLSPVLICLLRTASDFSPGICWCVGGSSESFCAYLKSIRVECSYSCSLNSWREQMCLRLGFLNHLYSKDDWITSSAFLSLFLQTELGGLTLQGKVERWALLCTWGKSLIYLANPY